MRVSKIIPFLRPQDFEQEQYQSGVRMEQFISGYGKKTEQYISGYTPSQGVAYQFKDLSKVEINITHGEASNYGTNQNVITEAMVMDLNAKLLSGKYLPYYNGVLNYIARWADAKVGGSSYVGASYYGLAATTYKDVLLTFVEQTGMGLAVVYNEMHQFSTKISFGSSTINYEYRGLPLKQWVSGNSSGAQYGNANATFITSIVTSLDNLQKIEVGQMPIYATREIEDKANPIYSERQVPVYDYRWREISPK